MFLKLIRKQKIISQRFLTFGFWGGVNAVLAYGVYALLVKLNLNYLVAGTLSFILGTSFGYLVNSKYTFKRDISHHLYLKYLIIYIISYFLNLGLLYLFVDIFHISSYLAPVFCMGVMAIVNYFLVRIVLFKK